MKIKIAAVVVAALIATYVGAILTLSASADTPPARCAEFTAQVADGLIAAGHSIAYSGNGDWHVDGELVGRAAAEDVDFTACGSPRVMDAIAAAAGTGERCGYVFDDETAATLEGMGHRTEFVWDDFDGGRWHVDGVAVNSTDGPDVAATGCAPAAIADAIAAAQR